MEINKYESEKNIIVDYMSSKQCWTREREDGSTYVTCKTKVKPKVKATKTHTKHYDTAEACEREYELWSEIRDKLGEERASEYFCLPHSRSSNTTIIFPYCGTDLTDQRTVDMITKLGGDVWVKIFKHVARGLLLLHSIGILHLDVKPDNIMVEMVSNTIKVRIIDLGISVYAWDDFEIAPVIDLVNNKIIKKPTYPYYPPQITYFSSWMDDLQRDDLMKACNLVTDYQKEHRNLIKQYYRDTIESINLIALYQGDDPRVTIYKMNTNPHLLEDRRKLELKSWDAWGFGMSIVVILYFINPDMSDTSYQLLRDAANQFAHPDALKRLTLDQFLMKV